MNENIQNLTQEIIKIREALEIQDNINQEMRDLIIKLNLDLKNKEDKKNTNN
jgi:hypothetical protein